MRVAVASESELDAAYAVIIECREALEARDLLQWDPQYPSRSFFQEAVADGNLFVLREDKRVKGVVVLNQWQPPEWSTVAWHEQGPSFLVIHAFAIAPHFQRRGHGRVLLNFCESFAGKVGYTSLRLDAFSEHSAALQFYERHGYSRRGEVRFSSKPAGHQQYYCYEKSLAKNAS